MSRLKNIFLVEDDEDDQCFFADALSHIKDVSLIAVASNGEEALQQLMTFASLPDIVFMDINMPLMNGIDCLAAMKSNLLTRDIPVVLLSTYSGTILQFDHLDIHAYIRKPSSSVTLLKELEQILA